MSEHWRPICINNGKYADRYDISDYGRVRASLTCRVGGSRPGRVLFQSRDTKGYPQVIIYCGKPHTIKVHRLVATAFLGERGDLTVNHIDGDKTNNKVTNLEYVSNVENTRHALRTIRNQWYLVDGRKLTLGEAVEAYGGTGVTEKVARRRIHRNKWEPVYAIKTPIGHTGRPTADIVASRPRVA